MADRLATRGRKAAEAIESHVDLAREVLPEALALAGAGAPGAARARRRARPRARDLTPGPELGRLLAEIAEAQFCGEVGTRAEALALAARLRGEA